MRFLFVHQNCPGQYVHYVRHLLARDGHEVFFLTAPNGNEIPGLRKVNYLPQAASTPGIHPDAVDFESGMIRARSAHDRALQLAGTLLLLRDEGAALLDGAAPDNAALLLSNPLLPDAESAREAFDEFRLQSIWTGVAIILRPGAGQRVEDGPLTVGTLIQEVMTEGALFRDIGIASLVMAFLSVAPPLMMPEDAAAALALFIQAANSGHAGAAFACGALLGGGHAVTEDRPRAERFFRQAAHQGHPRAQMMLGRYLLRGLGGTRDAAQAAQWLEKAALQGVEEARAMLKAAG